MSMYLELERCETAHDNTIKENATMSTINQPNKLAPKCRKRINSKRTETKIISAINKSYELVQEKKRNRKVEDKNRNQNYRHHQYV